ncbi:MAG: ABC transporter ATP-binding protein [Calditrichae bacterium]|nr:ABC transporter ATP-binding protein [Calditrichota bacterium]MCB9057571.1 ABC transporter ATP-binding protein [Calditrichia bacterium]
MFSENHKTAVYCNNVSYVYPDGTQALKNINFRLLPGEKAAIIGPNGAGKSTFLQLLNGIKRPQGEIKIFETLLSEKNLRNIKTHVGLVFQNPDDQLFCPTIFDDLAFGPVNLGMKEDETESRVTKALMDVGLQGYEKRSSLHLSYGERKLAAIASILTMNPWLIAMDEPTSNLDPLHRRKIIQWINRSNLTCLLTTHDMDMITETCQKVVLFNKGQVMAEGETKKILKDKKLLEENDLELPLKWQ